MEPGSDACVSCSTVTFAIILLSLGEYQEHHSNGQVYHLETKLPLLGSLKVISLDLAEQVVGVLKNQLSE